MDANYVSKISSAAIQNICQFNDCAISALVLYYYCDAASSLYFETAITAIKLIYACQFELLVEMKSALAICTLNPALKYFPCVCIFSHFKGNFLNKRISIS